MKEAALSTALSALSTGPRVSIDAALDAVPNAPGLYAIFGDQQALDALGTGRHDQPLYVGKAERSLVGRDVRTHFATGKTGSSTVRRTLAALLRHQLSLRAVPRNLERPDGSANYSLEAAGDERLTGWMHARLQLAVWVSPCDVVLDKVETAVLAELLPPLNLSKMGTQGDQRVKNARALMAAESRGWRRG